MAKNMFIGATEHRTHLASLILLACIKRFPLLFVGWFCGFSAVFVTLVAVLTCSLCGHTYCKTLGITFLL